MQDHSHHHLQKYKNQDNCTLIHPALTIEGPCEKYQIWGASCKKPVLKDADIYISLDKNCPVFKFEQPWNSNPLNQQHIRYFIEDFSVPKSLTQFNSLLDFTCEQIKAHKKIHAGCISAHGRTGLFFSALIQRINPDFLEKNDLSAIDYVRENYCHKAVETLEQVFFLNIHFNVSYPKKEINSITWIKDEYEKTHSISFDESVQQENFKEIFNFIRHFQTQKKHTLKIKM